MATDQKSRRRSARAEAKRELIVGCAMRHFAEHGYQGARIEDMAAELQIAKGSVFQHYGSKAGLFLECYKRAVVDAARVARRPRRASRTTASSPSSGTGSDRTAAPRRGGLGAQPRRARRELRHRPRAQARAQPVPRERGPLRHARLRRVGPAARRGARRPRPRDDRVAPRLDVLGAIQDALVTEELDPGLFHRWRSQPERQRMRLDHFAVLLESAIGSTSSAGRRWPRSTQASPGGGGAPRERPPASPSACGSCAARSGRTWSPPATSCCGAPSGTSASTRAGRGTAGPRAGVRNVTPSVSQMNRIPLPGRRLRAVRARPRRTAGTAPGSGS